MLAGIVCDGKEALRTVSGPIKASSIFEGFQSSHGQRRPSRGLIFVALMTLIGLLWTPSGAGDSFRNFIADKEFCK